MSIGNIVIAEQVCEVDRSGRDHPDFEWLGEGYSRQVYRHKVSNVVYKVVEKDYPDRNVIEYQNFKFVRNEWKPGWLTAPRARLFLDGMVIAEAYIPDQSWSKMCDCNSDFDDLAVKTCQAWETCWPGYLRRFKSRYSALQRRGFEDLHFGNVHFYRNKWWLVDGGE